MHVLSQSQVKETIDTLKTEYPDAHCTLTHKNPLQLLISLILAAQCTDKMVDKITPYLFAKYKNVRDFAEAYMEELMDIIKPTGFYRNKAKNIIQCCQKLLMYFDGKVPQTMEELTSLPGIGRKSANIILTDAFGIVEGIAVDTHVKRLSKRIGFTSEEEPEKVEKDLLKLLPREDWRYFNHLLVFHGRNICKSQNPQCHICRINHICRYFSRNG